MADHSGSVTSGLGVLICGETLLYVLDGLVNRYATRKFDGDDCYSWAVFLKEDIPKGHRGPVFYGEAKPIICGLSREEARYHKSNLEERAREKK